MKKLLIILCALLVTFAFSSDIFAKSKKGRDVPVQSYTTSKGTRVKGHIRSAPNSTKRDNWSTKGNVNPYNGKMGTKK